MVQFSEESPFLQDEGDGQPSAVCSQHVRSLELLKTIVQVSSYTLSLPVGFCLARLCLGSWCTWSGLFFLYSTHGV